MRLWLSRASTRGTQRFLSRSEGGVVISKRLRSARQAAHMTQQQVGDRLRPQHTRKNVCKWEHGQTEPSLSTIEQLAAALGVSPCWLAFGCEVDHGK